MKKPFVTVQQLEDIAARYPTPFHLYDEQGIRENARRELRNAGFPAEKISQVIKRG